MFAAAVSTRAGECGNCWPSLRRSSRRHKPPPATPSSCRPHPRGCYLNTPFRGEVGSRQHGLPAVGVRRGNMAASARFVSLFDIMSSTGRASAQRPHGARQSTRMQLMASQAQWIRRTFDACRDNNVKVLREALASRWKADVTSATTPNGATPFFIACEKVRSADAAMLGWYNAWPCRRCWQCVQVCTACVWLRV